LGAVAPDASQDSVLAANLSDITDPTGHLADPFGAVNPASLSQVIKDGGFFDRFDVTGLEIAEVKPDLGQTDLGSKSVVWLLRLRVTGGVATLMHDRYTTAQAAALQPEDLADVIGASVTLVSKDTDGDGSADIQPDNGAWMKIKVRAREAKRLSGESNSEAANQVPVRIDNRAFAQAYDHVQFPARPGQTLGLAGASSYAPVFVSGGQVGVSAWKNLVSGGALSEPERDKELKFALSGESHNQTLPATSVVIEDGPATESSFIGYEGQTNAEFWNNLRMTGLSARIEESTSSPDQVEVCLYGPYGTGGAEGWRCAAASAPDDVVLPVTDAAELAKAQGLRLTFSRADGKTFGPAWHVGAELRAKLRQTKLDGTGAVDFSKNNRALNTVAVTVENSDLVTEVNGERVGAIATAKASHHAEWGPGSRVLGLGKLANGGSRVATPGDSAATAAVVPFELEVVNAGTGYLTLESLVDTLPPGLHLAPVPRGDAVGEAYSLSGQFTTLDPSPDFAVSLDDQSGQETATFSWPSQGGANRLAPGEWFTITVYVWMEVGACPPGVHAVNTVTVNTTEALDAVEQEGPSPVEWTATEPTVASTTDYLVTEPGTSFAVAKGVKGPTGAGAWAKGSAGTECVPTVLGPGETEPSYFTDPCVAESTIGGTDRWVLHAVNTGSTPVAGATFFEALPTAADKLLVAGSLRGSSYRPQLVPGSLAVEARDAKGNLVSGTTVTEVTFDPEPCEGAWDALSANPNSAPCSGAGVTWVVAGQSTDWSSVTAIRLSLGFLPNLPSAGVVNISFQTLNVPEIMGDAGSNGGVSVDVDIVQPSDPEHAWGQFGTAYLAAGYEKAVLVASERAGVRLTTGALEISKVLAGDDSSRAPGEFEATVKCSLPWTDLDGQRRSADITFGGQATGLVPLEASSGLKTAVHGLPVGSICEVGESGELGDYGEDERDLPDEPVAIATDSPTGRAKLVNTYELKDEPGDEPRDEPSDEPTDEPSAGAVPPNAAEKPSPSSSSAKGGLPFSGSNAGWLGVLAVAVTALGSLAFAWSRRSWAGMHGGQGSHRK
jgi:hypothetical protein